ncbi:MAG TPA: ABC transporter permease subunit [Desulfocapsa sulfexigens]|nr:ABC transporter permease subunit [Desulfocapsa sulfexigens]
MEQLLTRERILTAVGFLLLLSGWQILSMNMHEIILASPVQTISALWNMLGTSYFNEHFLITLKRISVGILLGGVGGFILGLAGGLSSDIKCLLEPLRWLIMSVPPVIVVVLAMLRFGMGSTMAIFIVSVMVAPTVYINTARGIEMVDKNLVEVSHLYKFNALMLIKDVYIPAIVGPLSAAVVMVTCQGARVVVMAELLGANDGIGYALGVTRSNLEIPQLFAWVLTSLAIVAVFEFILFKPVQNYFLRWKVCSR